MDDSRTDAPAASRDQGRFSFEVIHS